MKTIAINNAFPKAIQVTDRFTYRNLHMEPFQDIQDASHRVGPIRPGERSMIKQAKGKEAEHSAPKSSAMGTNEDKENSYWPEK